MVERRGARGLKELKESVEEAIKDFNRYRSPEATAKLVKINKNKLKIRFSGAFCRTCGFYDYFDDLKIILEDKGIKSKVSEIEEKEYGAIVSFTL
jgi:superoxide reductase